MKIDLALNTQRRDEHAIAKVTAKKQKNHGEKKIQYKLKSNEIKQKPMTWRRFHNKERKKENINKHKKKNYAYECTKKASKEMVMFN